jgi:hypothetical protein
MYIKGKYAEQNVAIFGSPLKPIASWKDDGQGSPWLVDDRSGETVGWLSL